MNFNFSGTETNKSHHQDAIENVVILGSGPAGLSAALYAARAELKPLLLTGMELGGQASLTHSIENYPGFPDGVGGSELGDLFQKQAERFGARIEFDTVVSVDFSQQPYLVKTYGKEIKSHSVIISTGASPTHLNIPGEKEFTGKGVSYCATCDGFFFKDKKVVVVGGGDSALEEALFLTRYASSVTIIHRRNELRAGAILQNRAKNNPKISFIWDSVVKEVLGSEVVQQLLVENVKDGAISKLDTDGFFIFIGHKPNNQMYAGQIVMDDKGYLVTDMKMQTNIPGVFAAGEAADPTYKQVITSAGMGAAAGMMASKYLEDILE